MKKFLAIFLFSSFIAKAQPGKEAWHWNFGGIAAIDFSSGAAVSGITPWFNSTINCASISDPITGQLIMYTTGAFIANSTTYTIYNGIGLFGSEFASQGTLIVPKPGSNNIYYVISTDEMIPYPAPITSPHPGHNNKGIHYSVVDMSLHNGLGEVVLKNQLLTVPPTCEKVTAVRNCNGTDYWIITHPYLSNSFNVYLVTAAGIDTTPVVSHVGSIVKDTADRPQAYEREWGCFKASPNGKKLVFAEADSLAFLEIYDFDNSTGIVTNPIKISYANEGRGIFGVSFSPDNSKLYATTTSYPKPEIIYQYDLSSNTAAGILASQYIVADSLKYNIHAVGEVGAIQMAPDGKIYIARYGVDTLAVINNPNNLGASCNFKLSGFPLAASSCSFFGLPNFIDANYAGIQLNIPNVQQCNSFPADTLNAGPGFTSYQWSTGVTTNSIVINAPGKYWVTVTNQQGCTKTDTVHAYLINPVKKNIDACTTFTANATQNAALNYSWYDSTANPVKTFTTSGNYWVNISYIGGCVITDTFNITINPLPVINLPNIVTPNNDNINDEIDFGIYPFSSLQLEIYNRWGLKVFESNDPTCVWQPTVNDNEGTYFANLQFKNYCEASSQAKTLNIFITLTR